MWYSDVALRTRAALPRTPSNSAPNSPSITCGPRTPLRRGTIDTRRRVSPALPRQARRRGHSWIYRRRRNIGRIASQRLGPGLRRAAKADYAAITRTLDASCSARVHAPSRARGRPAHTRDDCWIIISESLRHHRVGNPSPWWRGIAECTPARSHCEFGDYHSGKLSRIWSFLHRRPRRNANRRAVTCHADWPAFPALRTARRR